jgi:hypothetical protein
VAKLFDGYKTAWLNEIEFNPRSMFENPTSNIWNILLSTAGYIENFK